MPAMFRMPAELRKDPERGLLSRVLLTASPRTYCVVRYWESKEKLYAYASASDAFRHRAWARVDRLERRGKVRGHVGIWHEAYSVPEGSCEAVYGDMPAFGLAAAHGRVPLGERGRYARDRFAHRPAPWEERAAAALRLPFPLGGVSPSCAGPPTGGPRRR
ncbi:DUF4188 domain-containing protein [Streptomyces sp. IBSBF 2807]|nr:DUF4188 domain-containing protein [Streptomyces hilarionis]